MVKWPKGTATANLKRACKKYSDLILTGKLVAIDPSSGGTSNPGYCYCDGGAIMDSGELPIMERGSSIQERLRKLADVLAFNFGDADVLAIEYVRGRMAHEYLIWSIGATLVGCRAPVVLFVPIPAWKALAKTQDDYEKGDEADARAIAETCMLLAKET